MYFDFCDSADQVVEIRAHIDDMTGEHLAVAMEQLLEAGSLDVVAAPLLMKKGRPGFLLIVLTKPEEAERIGRLVLQVTSTAGVRFNACPRLVKPVTFKKICWSGEYVLVKKTGAGETATYKVEAEDVRRLARRTGRSFAAISAAVLAEAGRF